MAPKNWLTPKRVKSQCYLRINVIVELQEFIAKRRYEFYNKMMVLFKERRRAIIL